MRLSCLRMAPSGNRGGVKDWWIRVWMLYYLLCYSCKDYNGFSKCFYEFVFCAC